MENQAILKRLQEKAPNYNVTKWVSEDEQRRKLLSSICEYPYQLEAVSGNRQGSDSLYASQTRYQNGQPDYIIKKRNKTVGSGEVYQRKRGYNTADGTGKHPTTTQIIKRQ